MLAYARPYAPLPSRVSCVATGCSEACRWTSALACASDRAALLVLSRIVGQVLFPGFVLLCGITHFLRALVLFVDEVPELVSVVEATVLYMMTSMSMISAIYLTMYGSELAHLLTMIEVHRKGHAETLIRETMSQHQARELQLARDHQTRVGVQEVVHELSAAIKSVEAAGQAHSNMVKEAVTSLGVQVSRMSDSANLNDQLFSQLKTLLTSTTDSVNALIAFVITNEEVIGSHWHALAKIKILRNEVCAGSSLEL